MSAVIDFNLWSHTPPSQVVCLNRLCTYIFHTSEGILKKRSVSLGSQTKPFLVNAETPALQLWMLIASMLSDSGWFWEFSGVRLKVFIQDLRRIMHLIVRLHAVVGTIQQHPRIRMLITSTTKQRTCIFRLLGQLRLTVCRCRGRSRWRRARPLCTRTLYKKLLWPYFKCQLQCCDQLSAWADTRRARKHMLLSLQSAFDLMSVERRLHVDVSSLLCDIQTFSP